MLGLPIARSNCDRVWLVGRSVRVIVDAQSVLQEVDEYCNHHFQLKHDNRESASIDDCPCFELESVCAI